MVNLSCRKPIIFYDFNYEEEFPSITFNVLHNLSSGIRARKVACNQPSSIFTSHFCIYFAK